MSIIYGELTKSFMGYKPGAKLFLDQSEKYFAIIFEEEDENYGWTLNTNLIPEYKILDTIICDYKGLNVAKHKFNAYYSLLLNKVKIPVTFELFQ